MLDSQYLLTHNGSQVRIMNGDGVNLTEFTEWYTAAGLMGAVRDTICLSPSIGLVWFGVVI